MDSRWFDDCKTPEDKEKRKKELKAWKTAFENLENLLNKYFKKKPAVRDYEQTNWMAKQIAVNEYNSVLDDILKLIKEKE